MGHPKHYFHLLLIYSRSHLIFDMRANYTKCILKKVSYNYVSISQFRITYLRYEYGLHRAMDYKYAFW